MPIHVSEPMELLLVFVLVLGVIGFLRYAERFMDQPDDQSE